MEIAITGAGGYLGSALVRKHLERGDAVRALLRDSAKTAPDARARVFRGDLMQPDAIPSAFLEQADVVYHCAAELSRTTLMRAVNVEGTRALAARARGRIRHWIQVSTVAVYGRPRECVMTEESPLQPEDSYAGTKAEADGVLAEASRGEFAYTVLRPSGIFGPGMGSAYLYRLISALHRGRFCFVGRPGAIMNCVHEDNVVHALLLCATQPAARQRVYNLSDDCTLERFVAVLCGELGRPPPRLRLPEPLARALAALAPLAPAFPLTRPRVDALTSRVQYPGARIERELAYRCVKPLETGLAELVSEWRRSAR